MTLPFPERRYASPAAWYQGWLKWRAEQRAAEESEMKINRDEAHQHLQAGRPVAFRSGPGPGTTITPTIGKRAVQSLPPEDVAGDYFLLRDESGNLTRAGMEQALREGGAVMYHGNVIETANDLPDEVELVRGNERARKTLADSLDAQMTALAAQRARLNPSEEGREEETPAVKQARQTRDQRAAEEEKARQEQERQLRERGEASPQHEADRRREAILARGLPPGQEQAELAALAQEMGGQAAPSVQETQAAREQVAREQAEHAERQQREAETRRQAEAEQQQRRGRGRREGGE